MSAWDDLQDKLKTGGGQFSGDAKGGGTDLKNAFGSIYGNGSVLNSVGNALGFGPGDHTAEQKAEGYLDQLTHGYDGMKSPDFSHVDISGPDRASDAVAAGVGPSAMNRIATNPEYNKAQMAQLSALQSLAANGGHDAASDANLAKIRANENQNARGQREAIMQNAQARGMGGSGASLLASLTGSQGAVDRQSAGDMNVAGMEANKALGAGQGAAAIGANMENQDFGEKSAVAQANDAAAKFNAANTTGVSEFNTGKNQGVNNANAAAHNQGQMVNKVQIPQQGFANEMGIKGGQQNALGTGVNYYSDKYNTQQKAKGNKLGSVIGGLGTLGQIGAKSGWFGGGAAAGGAAAGGGGGMAGADAVDTAAEFGSMAWKGGRVPGHAVAPGNSPLNDFVPLSSAPDEVVVPRDLALHGSKDEIGSFVQHPPKIHTPGQRSGRDKEAMLSALKHIAQHGRAA